MDINCQPFHTTLPYCASRTSDPEAGNAIMEFLILHIQEIVRTKELESGTSWDEKKRLMQVENKILTSSLLDRYQTSIEKAFEDCILEEFRRTKQELQRMRRFEEQKESRPISPPRSRSSSLVGCREPPQDANIDSVCLPELDDIRSGPEVFSFYIAATTGWKGAGFKYCTKDESFVSLEWLERVDQISKIEGGQDLSRMDSSWY